MQHPIALAFDFDGVILDSEPTKLRAFASIFDEYPEEHERIVAYNARHRGVPRIEKIRFICEHILGYAQSDAVVEKFLMRYADALSHEMPHAALIQGVEQFLGSVPHPKYVCSSAPRHEVGSLLATHNIARHFTHVFGYPDSKTDVLTMLKRKHHQVVYFGDAWADYEASQRADVLFVGVVNDATRERFQQLAIPTIEHFEDAAAIAALVAQLTVPGT